MYGEFVFPRQDTGINMCNLQRFEILRVLPLPLPALFFYRDHFISRFIVPVSLSVFACLCVSTTAILAIADFLVLAEARSGVSHRIGGITAHANAFKREHT